MNTTEIVEFLKSQTFSFKPNIRPVYSNKPVTKFPLIAVSLSKTDTLVLGTENKQVTVMVMLDMYAKDCEVNGVKYEAGQIIEILSEELDKIIKTQYGMTRISQIDLTRNGKEQTISRFAVRYQGLLSDKGYIYKR
jgi:hypothetical protein